MKNKIVVITGAATGIGYAIAKQLTENNTVISIDRSAGKIENLKSTLPKVVSIKADITSNEDLKNAMSQIERQYGEIDVLINNAGKGFKFDFVKLDDNILLEQLATEMSINYLAPINLTKKAFPLLQKSSGPIVAFVSSGLAYMPVSHAASYSATKSAIHFVTMILRKQLKKLNIKVVEILPPVVETDMGKDAPIKTVRMNVDTFAKTVVTKLDKGELEYRANRNG